MPAAEPTNASDMFLIRRDRPDAISPKRQLLKLLANPTFHWLWSQDIINDYERGADAIEADERIMRRAEFDRVGFQLFLAALQLEPPVAVSVTTMRNARRRISQSPRTAERDLTMRFTSPVRWMARHTF